MSDLSLPRFPPPLAERDQLPPREVAAVMRQNVLAAFSERAFTEDVLSRRLFGREQITLNRPAAIRHVLIDNAENYARTSATVRLLYPIVGRGLFLAEGEEWRVQRRTVAPSFAPRTVPLVARLSPPSPVSWPRRSRLKRARSISPSTCSFSRLRSPAARCSRSRW